MRQAAIMWTALQYRALRLIRPREFFTSIIRCKLRKPPSA